MGEHAATMEISLSLLISLPFKAKSLGVLGVNQGGLRHFPIEGRGGLIAGIKRPINRSASVHGLGARRLTG